jgi:hypothetical protein
VNEVRLDRVFTFADQLSFLIPHEWIEVEDEPDTYMYHAPNADSGWFRVSLITSKNPTSKDKLRNLIAERAEKECGRVYESGDNIVVAWERLSEQDGVPICLCWWVVAHCFESGLGHEAIFSYTILRQHRQDPQTMERISLLAQLVSAAEFAERHVG